MHKTDALLFIGHKCDTHGAVEAAKIQRSQNSTCDYYIMMIYLSWVNNLIDIADYDNVFATI